MGKGDKSTRRGKISAGSYGNARRKPTVAAPVSKTPAPSAAPARTARKRG